MSRNYPVPDVGREISYDSFGRAISNYTWQDTQTPVTIIDFDYEYDKNSNITSQTFGHRTSDPYNMYTYDALDRLTEADYLVGVLTEDEQFTYDLLGNRTTLKNRAGNDVVYAHNNVNEYTAIGGNSLTHDNAGNMTECNLDYTYEYDYENRLNKITKNSVTKAEYTYDALGRRIEKIAGGVTTRYYYDGWRVLTEVEDDGQNEEQRDFVYGNYLDEVLIMIDPSGDDHYYAHDHLFSPVALIADDGTVEERYEYDAYGRMTRLDPDFTAWSGTPAGNPIAFTGQRLDELDGGDLLIMYYKNRYYLVDIGRFVQRDPTRYRDGMNLYEYVQSRPIVATDELGLMTIEAVGMPSYRAPIGHHFDSNTRCVKSFWMAIALRFNQEESKKISDAGGGMAVMRRYAKWQQKDCGCNKEGKYETLSEGVNASTYLRNLRSTTLAAGSGAIEIDNLDGNSSDFGVPWVSPMYSVLISKGFPLKSSCCSTGFIHVTSQFLIYAGRSAFSGGKVLRRSSNSISGEDDEHMPQIPGWAKPGNIIPIASGYIKTDISWNCSQKVTGTMSSNLDYTDAGGWNTRRGREADFYMYSPHSSTQDPDVFPIPFKKN